MKFTHEYDERGNHRLVATLGHQVVATGKWAGYRTPCRLAQRGTRHQWFCVTDYLAGEFEPDTVYTYSVAQKATTKEMRRTASAP